MNWCCRWLDIHHQRYESCIYFSCQIGHLHQCRDILVNKNNLSVVFTLGISKPASGGKVTRFCVFNLFFNIVCSPLKCTCMSGREITRSCRIWWTGRRTLTELAPCEKGTCSEVNHVHYSNDGSLIFDPFYSLGDSWNHSLTHSLCQTEAVMSRRLFLTRIQCCDISS